MDYLTNRLVENTIANNILNFQAGSIHAGPRGHHRSLRAAWSPTESMDSNQFVRSNNGVYRPTQRREMALLMVSKNVSIA